MPFDRGELAEIREAVREAHAKGERAGYDRARRELDTGLSVVKSLVSLPKWVLKAGFEESAHPRDHGQFSSGVGSPGKTPAAVSGTTTGDVDPHVAGLPAEARGVVGRVKARFDRFLLDNAGLVGRLGQAASVVDALLTTPEDVAKYPWLAGKFGANSTDTGGAVGGATGGLLPDHLAARVAAVALVKGWSALKAVAARLVGKAVPDDHHAAAGSVLAGLVNAIREELGLEPMDHDATADEFAGHLRAAPDAPPDASAALLHAAVILAHDAAEAGEDPAPLLDRLRELVADPEQLAAALAESDDADPDIVAKAVGRWIVSKAWDHSKHPRDKGGRFLPKHEIEAAKTDPAKARELESRVAPKDADKLKTALGEARGSTRESAGDLKGKRDAARSRGADLLARATAGKLGGAVSHEDLSALIDHLQDHATVADLRAARKALGGAGVKAGFEGHRTKEMMAHVLAKHVKRHVQGLRDADMQAAGLDRVPGDEPADVGVPIDREPTLEELETGVKPRQGNRRAGYADPNSRPYAGGLGEPDTGKPGWDAAVSGVATPSAAAPTPTPTAVDIVTEKTDIGQKMNHITMMSSAMGFVGISPDYADRYQELRSRHESLQSELHQRFEKPRMDAKDKADKERNAAMWDMQEKRVAALPVKERKNGWEIVDDGGIYHIRDPQTKESIYSGKLARVRAVAAESPPDASTPTPTPTASPAPAVTAPKPPMVGTSLKPRMKPPGGGENSHEGTVTPAGGGRPSTPQQSASTSVDAGSGVGYTPPVEPPKTGGGAGGGGKMDATAVPVGPKKVKTKPLSAKNGGGFEVTLDGSKYMMSGVKTEAVAVERATAQWRESREADEAEARRIGGLKADMAAAAAPPPASDPWGGLVARVAASVAHLDAHPKAASHSAHILEPRHMSSVHPDRRDAAVAAVEELRTHRHLSAAESVASDSAVRAALASPGQAAFDAMPPALMANVRYALQNLWSKSKDRALDATIRVAADKLGYKLSLKPDGYDDSPPADWQERTASRAAADEATAAGHARVDADWKR